VSFVTYPGANVGLLLKTVQAVSLASAPPPPPPPPPPGSVTPALVVGYMDASGNRQWTTVVDTVTTITGTAPFLVEFYGGDSVSAQTDSDTPAKAFHNLGFLMNYGEDLGGNWSLSGLPRDTDRGAPVFGHTYTTPGEHQASLLCRDSAGNQNLIRVNVVVTAPGAGVTMTPGVLPTFADNTVYNAPAGGTWPNITNQLDGRRNIIIRKTGSGADPVFGTVTLDGRNEPNATITRTGGIRFLNCDVATVTCGNVGFDYCAFVGGRVRQINLPPMLNGANEIFAQSRTALQASNVRMIRGLMLQDTGVLGESNAAGYNLIGEGRGFHFKNVASIKTSTAQHNIRGVFTYSSFRHGFLRNTVAGSVSFFKFQGWGATAASNTPDPWRDDDTVVDYPAGRVLGLPSSRLVIVDNIIGQAGDPNPSANAGAGPQNNLPTSPEGCELVSFEYNRFAATTQWFTIDLSGRNLGARENRLNLGAGAVVDVAAGTNHSEFPAGRIPPGWQSPYMTTGARPVPVP